MNRKNTMEEKQKLRPSIELATSLQRPVHIITKNLNGQHILTLTQHLDKHKIPYQMQQETNTLGYPLNQRFFVIIDNGKGEVALGPQFSSILITLVGYPRIGNSKKAKYLQTPSEIINFYQQFTRNQDISNQQKTIINSQFSNMIRQDTDPSSKPCNKIVFRSISKYKHHKKEEFYPQNSQRDHCNHQHSKAQLVILEDKNDQTYSKLCADLLQMNSLGVMEKVEKMEAIRKKTLFHTNNVKIYYLTNQKYHKELISTIAIGQIIVFLNNKQQILKSLIEEPKVYAICSNRDETIKILEKLKIAIRFPSNSLETSNYKAITRDEKRTLTTQKISIPQANSPSQNTLFKTFQNSPKIIKQNHSKSKQNGSKILQSEYYSGTHKKQNQKPKRQSIEDNQTRKKTLRTQQKYFQGPTKSKKSLKFVDDIPNQPSKIKKVKSLSKCLPEIINFLPNNSLTTENEYFQQKTISAESKMFKTHSIATSDFKNSLLSMVKPQKQMKIHAVFYRQFIHQFLSISNLMKTSNSTIFPNRAQFYKSFFNSKEFDREARKIKQKLRQTGQTGEQFNFLILILEEDVISFQKYCQIKSSSYDEDNHFDNTLKSSNLSTISRKNFKINLYLFISSQQALPHEVVDFGCIKLFKLPVPAFDKNQVPQKALQFIRQIFIPSCPCP